MQVTAYKDPVTGLLFESKKDYDKFLANRAREDASAKREKLKRDEAEAVRQTMARELESCEQFPALATRMYQHLLSTKKCKRNKKPLSVVDIRAKNWRLSESLRLAVDVEVELTGCPEQTYDDVFLRPAPPEVLYPFTLYGTGTSRSSRNQANFTYVYSIGADLAKLPKLLKSMRRTAELLREQDRHDDTVKAEAALVFNADPKLAELKKATQAAQDAVEAAQAAFAAAHQAQGKRQNKLMADVTKRMPFSGQAELDQLTKSAPLPTDRWTSNMVRHALLKPEAATA